MNEGRRSALHRGGYFCSRYAYVHNNPLSRIDPSGFGQVGADAIPCPDNASKPCGEKNDGGGIIGHVEVPGRRPYDIPAEPLALWDFIFNSEPSPSDTHGSEAPPGSGSPGAPEGEKPDACKASATAYSPKQFVDDTGSTILGLVDAVTFGGYEKLVEGLGLGTINHTPAYNAGLYGALAVSGGRLIYAGASFAIRLTPGISAAEAVASRNMLKGFFSTLGADHPRAYTAGEMMAKYGSEAAVVEAASRTDSTLNAAAAALAASSAQLASGCL